MFWYWKSSLRTIIVNGLLATYLGFTCAFILCIDWKFSPENNPETCKISGKVKLIFLRNCFFFSIQALKVDSGSFKMVMTNEFVYRFWIFYLKFSSMQAFIGVKLLMQSFLWLHLHQLLYAKLPVKSENTCDGTIRKVKFNKDNSLEEVCEECFLNEKWCTILQSFTVNRNIRTHIRTI